MELHEFQAKQLLSRYGVATPPGRVAVTGEEVERAAKELGSKVFLKAQIHAGDRAKAGGVRVAESAAAARVVANELLGRRLVTQQTGPEGHLVKRLLVEAAVEGGRELYLAAMVEPLSGSIMLLGGAGGTDIEERVAQKSSSLETLHLGLSGERKAGDIANFGERIGLSKEQTQKFQQVVGSIHKAFVELDAGLIEINPLVLTAAGDFIALDAKIILDDNALFRHPELAELREEDELDEVELKAQRSQINFVQLDGDIGVVVNGAGLGLATLDLLHAAGGSPANFMDIRTTAKSLDIAQGIGLVLDNPKVKVLFVNVFGGGMQPCDTIIEGLGIALRRKGRVLPVVLRVTGNNEDLAKIRVESFGLPKIHGADMWQAAQRAAAIAQGKAQ